MIGNHDEFAFSWYLSRQRLVCASRSSIRTNRGGRPLGPAFDDTAGFIAGVDTHDQTHTLAILTNTGGVESTTTFDADKHGYQALIDTLTTTGNILAIGVEGTNSYGAGLTRALVDAGYGVTEVLRPTRQVRRLHGKSDPIDAIAAARTVLAGDGTSRAKDTQTPAEALRFLLTARTQLVHAMTAMISCIRSLLVTAPEELRATYRGMPTARLISRLATSRPGTQPTTPATAAAYSLKQMAQTYRDHQKRADELDEQMNGLLIDAYPNLLAIYGASTVTAAELAVTAGGNPKRIRSEAAFASLCGVAPIPASSGKTNRHRVNHGGDRRGNKALHRIALVRMRHDSCTQAYVQRRLGEGKTKKDVLRCLKRTIAREVYKALIRPQVMDTTAAEGQQLADERVRRHISLSRAAQALNTYPARISDIEKHRRPLPVLTDQYKKWLEAA